MGLPKCVANTKEYDLNLKRNTAWPILIFDLNLMLQGLMDFAHKFHTN